MRSRFAGLGVGLAFGVTLSWSGMTSPNVIRQALLFQRSYLFLFFASAVLVAAIGSAVLRRVRTTAILTAAPISWARERVERRHIVGSLLFGLGWGISDACPGPIATQIGQGIVWAVPTIAGVLIGVHLFLSGSEPETEPATEPLRAAAGVVAGG
jgi:uncharacterized membrane protein YedE/YeeE